MEKYGELRSTGAWVSKRPKATFVETARASRYPTDILSKGKDNEQKYFTLSDPHQDISIMCFHLFSCHGEEHVAMVVSFAVFDLACRSSGLGLLFYAGEFASRCRQRLQLASKCFPVTTCHTKRHTHTGNSIVVVVVVVCLLWLCVVVVCCGCVCCGCVCCGCVLWLCVCVVAVYCGCVCVVVVCCGCVLWLCVVVVLVASVFVVLCVVVLCVCRGFVFVLVCLWLCVCDCVILVGLCSRGCVFVAVLVVVVVC